MDIENEFLKLGYAGPEKGLTRWCSTMKGREFGRVHSWGSGPKRRGDFEQHSPCTHLEFPQTLMEPILLRYATQHGFPCRFSTRLTRFDTSAPDFVLAEVEDRIYGTTQKVRCKYLYGADGAKSIVVKQLGLPMSIKPSQGIALNVLVRADLSDIMKSRTGNLHYIIQPDAEQQDFAAWSIMRMVKPWYEWLVIMMYKPTCPADFMPEKKQVEDQVKAVIGDGSTPVDILRIDKWIINETVAECYSKGQVFCLGDAVHRHPPMNGLGSNTCIQDAANLAWKVALVEKGLAGRSLLDSYTVERAPVGAGVVRRANSSLREHIPIFESLGFLSPSLQERKQQLAVLDEVSERGRARRQQLIDSIDYTCHEFLAQGSDMGQRYDSSAIFLDGAGEPPKPPADPVLYYEPHTYPGLRLPHAWLNTSIPQKPVSTLDLSGKGRFTLFTGHGGDTWRDAAAKVKEDLGVEVAVFAVGFGLEYEAVYNDWYHRREVNEDGCVLVRPDNFVAWRSRSLAEDCPATVLGVMRKILCL
ncbi:2,4-dichlorophenol 6-monooxygenase [Cladophialophora carrionii]|uniref:2,4-dichlorophenol 6-monooxygenase n=1 Tax=Cladophialophora carrionii TaxID=86049 RepID=A0A1C1CMA1_9EURO|nr:2,4-dichlorophenol 6-monooxygenase [Cladophialophora carrionii]